MVHKFVYSAWWWSHPPIFWKEKEGGEKQIWKSAPKSGCSVRTILEEGFHLFLWGHRGHSFLGSGAILRSCSLTWTSKSFSYCEIRLPAFVYNMDSSFSQFTSICVCVGVWMKAKSKPSVKESFYSGLSLSLFFQFATYFNSLFLNL